VCREGLASDSAGRNQVRLTQIARQFGVELVGGVRDKDLVPDEQRGAPPVGKLDSRVLS
jgi:hypothetical protein